MENIEFKINASPKAISFIGIEKVKTEFIPSVLAETFPSNPSEETIANKRYDQKADFYKLYDELIEITSQIKTEYEQILSNYHETGQILYSRRYLNLVAKAKSKRKILTEKFPELPNYNLQTDKLIRDSSDLSLDRAVGTGVNHILQMERIEKFVNENRDAMFNADISKKHFSMTNNIEHVAILDKKENAFKNAKLIEYQLNSSMSLADKRKLGRISVNPIFEHVSFTKIPNNKILTLLMSYPNGDTDEELGALLENVAKKSQSSETEFRFKNADQQEVQELAQGIARKGYLRDVRYNNISIIDIQKSTFKRKE